MDVQEEEVRVDHQKQHNKGFLTDEYLEDKEIECEIKQEFLAKKSGMTNEQILNGEHFDIEFNH